MNFVGCASDKACNRLSPATKTEKGYLEDETPYKCDATKNYV